MVDKPDPVFSMVLLIPLHHQHAVNGINDEGTTGGSDSVGRTTEPYFRRVLRPLYTPPELMPIPSDCTVAGLQMRTSYMCLKPRLPFFNSPSTWHVTRKYLKLNRYGGKVALHAPLQCRKEVAAIKGSALILREFIFDHPLGRGN
ncbi:hypothetical protein PHMEG_0004936 [Phytophthora megakarya]|uniref:Uncharacterized protein n=1 Tax=Phytophthora megakarya TaxID=4795 RepID=A0A225WSP4_9STRA|nr:hypothetical protein PHMEG_0004936 [Phytophthora megakarya]